MDMELSNEEIAERIQAGDHVKEYYAILWERLKGLIIKMIQKYQGHTRIRNYIDFDDLLQCGFLAIARAVKNYDAIKNHPLIAYLNFALAREAKDLIHARMDYIDGKATWVDRCREAKESLNKRIGDGDEDEKELQDFVIDEEAGRFVEDCEKDEIRAIVAAAVERLQQKQRHVITEVYFNGKQKLDLVDGIIFESYDAVCSAEQSAILNLRRDKALRTIYYDCYNEPQSLSPLHNTPERIVVANETANEWLQHVRRLLQYKYEYHTTNEWLEYINRAKEQFA